MSGKLFLGFSTVALDPFRNLFLTPLRFPVFREEAVVFLSLLICF